MKIINNLKGEKMKTDKFGIQINIGDFVYIDDYAGMEYGTSAGTIQQIKKIGTKRVHFDSGHTNLRTAEFHNVTAYTLIRMEEKVETYGIFVYPKFVRTATNDEMYNSIVSKLKQGSDKKLSDALIKNETYRYENQLARYKLKNDGHGFSVIFKKENSQVTFHGAPITIKERA